MKCFVAGSHFWSMSRESRADQLPWVEKYRPGTLSEVVSHDSAISTIRKLIEQHCLPHLLFYGPPGTGKTTTAHAIAHELYGPKFGPMVLELNASDDRGIDVVREQVKRFASNRVMFGTGHKLIILDESDAMTNPAQAALRRIMEKFSSNVRFVMICNYPEKLIPALRSRCTEFRFPPLPEAHSRQFLEDIARQEGLEWTPDGIGALMRLSLGDLRRSLNLMQTTSLASGVINEATVYQCAGYPLPEEIREQLQGLLNQPLEAAVAGLDTLRSDRGLALLDIVSELHQQTVLLELPGMALANIIDNLAQIEKRIAEGGSDKIQTKAIAAAYQILRLQLDNA
jgi:replication factor C subunit 3/5